MDCQEVHEKLSDFLDRETAEEICRQIEEHLKHCDGCTVVVDKTRKTIMLYQADRAIDVPVALTRRLEEALAAEYRRGS